MKRVEDKIGGLQPPGLQHPPTTGMGGRIGIRRIKKNTLKMRSLEAADGRPPPPTGEFFYA